MPSPAESFHLVELVSVLTFQGGYNTNLVLIGTSLLGVAAGIIGVFALLRKRSLVADAVGHATLPGLAGAFLMASWLGHDGRSLPILLVGASVSGVLGLIVMGLILRHTRLQEDAAIGIVLSVFFGAGVVGLSIIQNQAPAGSGGIRGFIYGQAATMLPSDITLLAVLAIGSIGLSLLLIKELALVAFDE